MPRPYVIGITGGSASGKTTITNRLVELLPEYRFSVLHQDRYFKAFTFLPDHERELLATANNPDALGVSEFQLRYRLSYRLLDKNAVETFPVTEILLVRDFSFNDQNTVSKESEEALLFRDMQSDPVQQLVRRLQVARLKPAS